MILEKKKCQIQEKSITFYTVLDIVKSFSNHYKMNTKTVNRKTLYRLKLHAFFIRNTNVRCTRQEFSVFQ